MYNYREEIKNDIRNILESETDSRDFEKLYEMLWVDDSVTGNSSGSYTFSRDLAKEYIADNLELLGEALNSFEYKESSALEKGAEKCDVIIRCYLLGECLADTLEEIK